MKKTMYRVGAQGDIPMWLTIAATLGTTPINDCNSLNCDRKEAAILPPKIAMTWVQVLAARYECVIVERVEVGHV